MQLLCVLVQCAHLHLKKNVANQTRRKLHDNYMLCIDFVGNSCLKWVQTYFVDFVSLLSQILIRMQKQNDRTRILSNKTTSNKIRYKKKSLFFDAARFNRFNFVKCSERAPFILSSMYLIKVHQSKRITVSPKHFNY